MSVSDLNPYRWQRNFSKIVAMLESTEKENINEFFEKLYYSFDSPSAFSGIKPLFREAKKKRKKHQT